MKPTPSAFERSAVVITGATGFIGSRLAAKLVQTGHTVRAIVRPSSKTDLLCRMAPGISLTYYDGTLGSLAPCFEDRRPGLVFHLASCFKAEHAPADVDALVTSNVLFGTQLAETMAGFGCHTLINAGTSWQHYQDAEYDPVCLYAATKQAFEMILRYYVNAHGFRAITLLLYDTYGPHDVRPKLFSSLRRCRETGEPLALSPGDQLVDFVYIDDVLSALMQAGALIESQASGQAASYAVCTTKPVSLRKLVDVYQQVTHCRLKILWGARPYRRREVMVPWTDGNWLPGWQPAVSLEDGIRRMETVMA